jgi:hypothetical protein
VTEFEEEMLARLVAQEMMLVSTMGLLFAMTGNDPNWEKMKAILSSIQQIAETQQLQLPPSVKTKLTAVLSDMCSQVAEAAIGHRGTGPRAN